MSAHRADPGADGRCLRCGCAPDQAIHRRPPDQLTPEELGDRVSELAELDCRYALQWLATSGSQHPDGQALLRALDAVSRYNDRIAAAADR